jgi:hypothetical protein
MWPFKKRRSDEDIIIDVLEEAARRSHSDEQLELRLYGPAEIPIIRDLIESGMVRGVMGHVEGGLAIGLQSITLSGRQLRDELLDKRRAKTFWSRLKKVGWAALGSIGTLIFEYLKAKIASK